MKRYSFITVGAAAALAGCGGSVHHLPPLFHSAGQTSASGGPDYLPVGPIPQSVLNNPIIGEYWRFAGTVAPPGWAFADGRMLQIAESGSLFKVLGRSAGGDGKTTFALPKATHAPAIVAVAGTFPTSPAMLASLNRGKRERYGVSTPGMHVEPAMVKPPVREVVRDNKPTWWPGTVATPEQIAAQQHTVAPLRHR